MIAFRYLLCVGSGGAAGGLDYGSRDGVTCVNL